MRRKKTSARRWRLLLSLLYATTTRSSSEHECEQCGASRRAQQKRGFAEALDAVAMATLAQLAYAEWHNDDRDGWFEVHGKGRFLRETWRYVWCVLRSARAAPGSRYPRPEPIATSRRRCDRPMRRRWELAWWLWGWHDASQWHSTNALVSVRPSDGAVAIAFRGSADARNAATNLQPMTQPDDTEPPVPGRTLHGIRRAFTCVDRGNVTQLHHSYSFPVLEDLAALGDRRRPLADALAATANDVLASGRRLFLTGHSLGAALAVQLAARVLPASSSSSEKSQERGVFFSRRRRRRRPSRRDVRLFTFGEPAFGDAEFYAAHAHLAAPARRFLSLSRAPFCQPDVVAHVATAFGAGPHAAPPTFVCDPRRPPGPITAHAMAAYVRGFRALARPWLDLHVAVPPAVIPHLMPNRNASSR